LNRKINFDEFLIFDGAMGTMLQKSGLKQGEIPESYNILHPEIIEKYIPDSKFYNLTASGATLNDDLRILEYFIDRKYNVKNVYLQIDIRENMDAYKYNKNDYLRKDKKYKPWHSYECYWQHKKSKDMPLITT